MNKQKLINGIAEKAELSKTVTRKSLNAALDAITIKREKRQRCYPDRVRRL